MVLNNDQISVYGYHFDITVKVTFDLLDVKCHHFILSYYTLV